MPRIFSSNLKLSSTNNDLSWLIPSLSKLLPVVLYESVPFFEYIPLLDKLNFLGDESNSFQNPDVR